MCVHCTRRNCFHCSSRRQSVTVTVSTVHSVLYVETLVSVLYTVLTVTVSNVHWTSFTVTWTSIQCTYFCGEDSVEWGKTDCRVNIWKYQALKELQYFLKVEILKYEYTTSYFTIPKLSLNNLIALDIYIIIYTISPDW